MPFYLVDSKYSSFSIEGTEYVVNEKGFVHIPVLTPAAVIYLRKIGGVEQIGMVFKEEDVVARSAKIEAFAREQLISLLTQSGQKPDQRKSTQSLLDSWTSFVAIRQAQTKPSEAA